MSIGMLLLGILLILWGAVGILGLAIPMGVLYVLAIVAGIVILAGR